MQTIASGIRTASSMSTDARAAVAEIHAAIAQPDLQLVVFHCSPAYDRQQLAAALNERFRGARVVGCTTAGEITPNGYRNGSITAIGFGGHDFIAETVRIDSLHDFSIQRGITAGHAVRAALQARVPRVDRTNTFGFLLVDGLSVKEEAVVGALFQELGDIEMIGGSAGDETAFGSTWVFVDGEFRQDVAVYTLVHTTRPFRVFQTQHFDFGDARMVVTAADTEKRIVTEINGLPAGREYARIVGLNVDDLTPMIFAAHPVVVRIAGKPFVRSIAKVNSDESLTFFCAIDEGMVLTVARSANMHDRLAAAFAEVEAAIGKPDLILGCDCILRYLEMQQQGNVEQISRLLSDWRVVGFATYGEQYNGMHVNQTFTGIAIGAARA